MKPKVFQPNALTIVVSSMGESLFLGAHELKFFKSLKLEADIEKGTKAFSIDYLHSNDSEVQLRIEEEKRLLVAAGFIKPS